MTLNDLKNALLTVTQNVYRYKALKQSDKYIVWAEDGQGDSGYADNSMTTQALTGTVDYFTKSENDPAVQSIQAALNGLDISWRLNSVQYEDDTGYIHHEWVWAAVIGHG